jgi:hypothetical protein
LDEALDVGEGLLRVDEQGERLDLVVCGDGAGEVFAVVGFVFLDAEGQGEDEF